MSKINSDDEKWPSLPLEAWQDTSSTVHMWTQVIGKIRLQLAPMVNHWWQVAFHLTSQGLSTSLIPYHFNSSYCQIEFDFLDHKLFISLDNGESRLIELKPRSVSDFYKIVVEALKELGIQTSIWTTPVEVPDRTPFKRDTARVEYDAEYAEKHWRVLIQVDRVMKQQRRLVSGKDKPWSEVTNY